MFEPRPYCSPGPAETAKPGGESRHCRWEKDFSPVRLHIWTEDNSEAANLLDGNRDAGLQQVLVRTRDVVIQRSRGLWFAPRAMPLVSPCEAM